MLLLSFLLWLASTTPSLAFHHLTEPGSGDDCPSPHACTAGDAHRTEWDNGYHNTLQVLHGALHKTQNVYLAFPEDDTKTPPLLPEYHANPAPTYTGTGGMDYKYDIPSVESIYKPPASTR